MPPGLRSFSAKELERLLRKYGFVLVSQKEVIGNGVIPRRIRRSSFLIILLEIFRPAR